MDKIKCTRLYFAGKGIVIPVIVNDIETNGVVDTGADAAVISSYFASVAGIDTTGCKNACLLNAEDVAQNLKELQAFLGLTDYYRRFVQGYADIARSLHNLTRKGVTYHWGADQEIAFGALKKASRTAPILAYLLAEGM